MADSVARSFKVLAFARLAAQLITWVITLVVIRLLNPADYGLMALVGMVLGLFALVNDVGLSAALIQNRDVDAQLERSVLGAMIVLNGVLFGIVLALSAPAEAYFSSPGLAVILPVCGIQLLLNPVITFTDAQLRRGMRFTEKSRIEFVSGVGGGLASLGMALAGFGVWALVAGLLVVSVLRAVMGLFACRGVVVPSFRFAGMGRALGFGGYVTADRLMWFTANQSDVFLAGRLLGQDLLGIYAIAYQLVSLPMQKLSTILNDVGFAGFSRLQDDIAAARASYLKASRLTAFFAFPVFVGLGMVAPQLVLIVLGDEWALSGQLMMLMCFAFPFKMLNTVSHNVLLGLGKARMVAGFGLFSLLIMPASYAYAITAHGLEGLAIALPVVAVVQFAVVCYFTLRAIGVPIGQYIRAAALPAVIAAIMAAAVLLLGQLMAGGDTPDSMAVRVAELTASIAVGGLVFVGIAFVFARDIFATAWSIVRA